MVLYRRNFVQGGTFFFTVALRDRYKSYLIDYIDELRLSFQECKAKCPFDINAIVILPEHLHCIWTLPEREDNYPNRWRLIKSKFTRRLVRRGVKLIKDKHGQYNLWQRRYWEHTIRGERDLNTHVDYIHFNPVKHGLVRRVVDWPYSSFHRFVEKGKLPVDWAGEINCGEKIVLGNDSR